MSNTEIWDALGKTDPAHTKQFTRAGGFKGTAIKPIWLIRRLTEQFGAVGVGWGMGKPEFETVHGSEGEVLVYCTVECWHTSRENSFYGVGGDKAIGRNRNGLFVDDEAFKKAYTDAVGNAFKFLGSGADVHMGQFDDSKYVQQLEQEFAQREYPFPEGVAKNITELKKLARDVWRTVDDCGPGELEPFLALKETNAVTEQLGALTHPEHRKIWEGDGADNPGLYGLIQRKRAEEASGNMRAG